MNKKEIHRNGFTLVEAIASITIFALVMALAMSGLLFMMKNTHQDDTRHELDIEVQQTMERLKHDIRLSSLDEIYYYADENGSFQALSFPLGEDADTNGVLDKVAGKIVWGSQVIYHIRPTSPFQLVKTVFNPRDPELSKGERQAQLESVVDTGDASEAENGANATSTILFENLLHWEILPIAGRFNGYSPTLTRKKSSLGYALIPSGTHKLEFKVIGKNPDSSGYKIGIDQIYVSPSYSEREGETQTVDVESGATTADVYIPTGSWEGRHHLYFPATKTNDSFTLSMDNDRWEETNFGASGERLGNTDVEFDLALEDWVVKLDGNTQAWDASSQTGSEFGEDTSGMINTAVRILLKGSDFAENGNWISDSGRRCKFTFAASSVGDFEIRNAYIGESLSSEVSSMVYKEAPTSITFSMNVAPAGSTTTSDWVDFSIDREKSYLVSFETGGGVESAPKQWAVNPAEETVMVVSNLTTTISGDLNWATQTTTYADHAIGLESMFVSYPSTGTYTSQIFDTHLDAPQYDSILKTVINPPGTTVSLKARAGSDSALSDALAWDSVPASEFISAVSKRYIQFQALLTSDPDGLTTPILRDATISWLGEMGLVNIGGTFTQGPDYGIFEVSVDDEPLRTALIIQLEIYKIDARGLNNVSKTNSSSLKTDMTPRNSGL